MSWIDYDPLNPQPATPRKGSSHRLPPDPPATLRAPDSDRSWTTPGALPASCSAVPTLHSEMLPAALWDWAKDVAERICVPIDYTAAQVVWSAGAAIMRRLGICPKREDDWLEVPNLWAVTVAPPGSLKSPSRSEATRPLRKVAADLREEFQRESAHRESVKAIAKAKLDAAKDEAKKAAKGKGDLERARLAIERAQADVEMAEVHEPRLLTSDTTTEKLGELLLRNPHGIAIDRDEIAGWIYTFDKQGREGDREFYLEGWNGTGSFDVDRISRGSLHIPAACVAVSGTIQPSKLAAQFCRVLSGGSGGDGLFQRFQLLIYPDDLGEWVDIDRKPDMEAFDGLYAALTRLVGLDGGRASEETVNDVPVLRFSSDAQKLFTRWRDGLERRIRRGDLRSCPAFEGHIAKYRGLMPALALIFHAVEWASNSEAELPIPHISLRAAQMAASWCDYLEQHARKVYAQEVNPGPVAAQHLAGRIERGQLLDGMTVRDAQQHEWSGLKKSGDILAGLEVLAAIGWVRVERVNGGPRGGRPSKVIRVNPRLGGSSNG